MKSSPNSNIIKIDLNINEGPVHQFVKKMLYWMIREKKKRNIEVNKNNLIDISVDNYEGYRRKPLFGQSLINGWGNEMYLSELFAGKDIADVKLECEIEKGLIPDILVEYKDGIKIIIEIVVKGPPTVEKIKKLSDLNYGFYQLDYGYAGDQNIFYHSKPEDFWKYGANTIKLSGYSPFAMQIEKLSLNLGTISWTNRFTMRYLIKTKEFKLNLYGYRNGFGQEPEKRDEEHIWQKEKLFNIPFAQSLRLFQEIFAVACRHNLVGIENKNTLLLCYDADPDLPKEKIFKFQNYHQACSTVYVSNYENILKKYSEGGLVK